MTSPLTVLYNYTPRSQSMTHLLLAFLLAGSPAFANTPTGKPPVSNAAEQAEADRILAMPSDSPSARFNQLLAARDLSPGARFALAARAPGLVEQLEVEPYMVAMAYIGTLPSPDLGRVRGGQTIIRATKDMKKGSPELEAATAVAEQLNLKGKLEAMRVGTLDGRVVRVEATAGDKRVTVELAWPSTPERDDDSRNTLAKVYGARPTQRAMGPGAPLPLADGSFENPSALGSEWKIERGVDLGNGTPVEEVSIDPKVAIDGSSSLRFYANVKTRMFPEVAQRVTVVGGMSLVLRGQLRTENVRVEFHQKPTDLFLDLSFEDISGQPVGEAQRVVGNLETHTWQTIEIRAIVPDNAAYARIAMSSALSGTAWFDGLTLAIGE